MAVISEAMADWKFFCVQSSRSKFNAKAKAKSLFSIIVSYLVFFGHAYPYWNGTFHHQE
jgi:hypothetical protein